MPQVDRFSVSLDTELLAAFDHHIAGKGYANRSEAVRDMIRDLLLAMGRCTFTHVLASRVPARFLTGAARIEALDHSRRWSSKRAGCEIRDRGRHSVEPTLDSGAGGTTMPAAPEFGRHDRHVYIGCPGLKRLLAAEAGSDLSITSVPVPCCWQQSVS